MRRLPWFSPDGSPAYLASDGGWLSRLADGFEDDVLADAREIASALREIATGPLGSGILGDVLRRTADTLEAAALVGELRGERLGIVADD